jgi:hypothetical protein
MRSTHSSQPRDAIAEGDLTSERALYAATLVQIPDAKSDAVAAENGRHRDRTISILRAFAARRDSRRGAEPLPVS